MSTLAEIRGALQSRLAAVPGIPRIIYEGERLLDPGDEPHCRCKVLRSMRDRVNKGHCGMTEHRGSLEVVLHYPGGEGTLDIETMAEAIVEHFQVTDIAENGSAKVRFLNAEPRTVMESPDWVALPVSIDWYMFSTAQAEEA